MFILVDAYVSWDPPDVQGDALWDGGDQVLYGRDQGRGGPGPGLGSTFEHPYGVPAVSENVEMDEVRVGLEDWQGKLDGHSDRP